MRNISLILVAVIAVLLCLCCFQCSRINKLSDEVEIQKNNVEILKGNETIYKICDSLKVVEINALELEKDQFEKLIKEKDNQIAQIQKSRKKEIEYYTKLSKTDTFYIYKDRFINVTVGMDTCLGYYDNHLSLTQCQDCTYIEIRDTIKQTISAEYKHKFLWWKWGLKGFSQDVWSTNPHSQLHFDEFVKVTK